MITTAGNHSYTWLDNWATLPESESTHVNGRTHGVQVTKAGEVVVFCQADTGVLFFDEDGKLLRSWGDRFSGAHGMTLVEEDGVEYLWLTDQDSREVVKTTLDGETVQRIEQPKLSVYENGGRYVPTWVAVNEERWGGNGDIWVTDGYGSGLVHRYAKSGQYLSTLDGTTGAGKFACPHGIFFDTRSGAPRLYVADRSNHRGQVFDASGKFIKSFGEDAFVHPDCFAAHGDLLLVPELFGRVALMDGNDELIGYLGRNDTAKDLPGWPNLTPDQLEEGKFSSPHGGTFDHHGNIYIVEWIVGGRITKLQKA